MPCTADCGCTAGSHTGRGHLKSLAPVLKVEAGVVVQAIRGKAAAGAPTMLLIDGLGAQSNGHDLPRPASQADLHASQAGPLVAG